MQHDYIENINKEATTWTAGVNFHPDTPKDFILNRLGSEGVQVPTPANSHLYKTYPSPWIWWKRIPNTFDARKKWKSCYTIGEVRDQGNCKSSWALAVASVFADRLCIATNGRFNESLSTEQLAFCCRDCGKGCRGGSPIVAWNYIKTRGLVTGGNYNDKDGCQPYGVPPCLQFKSGKNSCASKPIQINHVCQTRCYGDRGLDFKFDLKYVTSSYYVNYTSIQKEIIDNGPIEASYNVYDDFIHYKSGVYVKSKNATLLGDHASKLIGWGEENGVPYWLLLNSWSSDWGMNGTFKIRRGTNECGIDYSMTAGIPELPLYY